MLRRICTLAALVLLLAPAGCVFDYFFFALVIEGDYPPGEWTELICIDFRNMPFELPKGTIRLEVNIDPPAGMTGGQFPTKLQHEMRGYGPLGDLLWKLRSKAWKVNAATGLIETDVPIAKTYVVPQGGRWCHWIKPFRRALMNGYLLGIDGERLET